MTLLCVFLRHDRALLGVDAATLHPDSVERLTDGINPFTYAPDDTLREHSKLSVLPQMHAVLALQGSSALHRHLREQLVWLADIEQAIARLPDMIRCAPRGALEFGNGGHAVHLVGWSRGGVVWASCATDDDFASGVRISVKRPGPGESTGSYSPHLPWSTWSPIDVRPLRGQPETPAEMLDFAQQQCAYARDPAPGEGKREPYFGPFAPFGGRLVVAVIDETGIAVSVPGDLGAPRSPAQNGADDRPAPSSTFQPVAEAVQIRVNAATDTDFSTIASGTVASSSGTVTSTITSLSWTNTTPDAVTVQLDYTVVGNVSFSGGGTGSARFEFGWSLSGGGGAGVDASPDLVATEQSSAHVIQRSVPAGSTITATLDGKAVRTAGTVTNNYRLANLRLSAIKR